MLQLQTGKCWHTVERAAPANGGPARSQRCRHDRVGSRCMLVGTVWQGALQLVWAPRAVGREVLKPHAGSTHRHSMCCTLLQAAPQALPGP